MEWSRSTPTKAGLYFAWGFLHRHDDTPQVEEVRVSETPTGPRYERWGGNHFSPEHAGELWWSEIPFDIESLPDLA